MMSDIARRRARGGATRAAVLLGVGIQLLVLLCVPTVAASGNETRELFVRAQTAIDNAQPQQARQLIEKLQHYPLVGYLELALARQQLPDSTHQAIDAVMREHKGLPAAFMLRREWLKKLARDGRWELLLTHHVEDGHTTSACLAAQAKWRLGKSEQAWQDARRLWLTGRSLPDLCDPLLAAWRAAGQLSSQLVWERVKLAMASGQIKLARHLRRYAGKKHARLIEQWISLRRQPAQLPQFVKTTGAKDANAAHLIAAVFTRTARRDPSRALAIFTKLNTERLPATLTSALRNQLSKALAHSGDPRAGAWLKYATSAKALRAQAVNALLNHQYDTVLKAIEAMEPEQAQRERWRYWRARSLATSGRNDEAGNVMRSLANERSYYGFLAADQTAQPYALGHRALTSSAARLAALGDDIRVRRTREWLALRRSIDARREWHALLNSLDTDGQRDAAMLAHSWPWHEGGIRAAAKAKAWDDLDIRFPLAHRADVVKAATRSKLPASRVYAVVRQESAFMQDIRSSAGALGLMQLMPATARQMARTARQRKPNRAAILEPANNLLLGSLYLAHLRSRYGGHAVLATAAYNAGPGRVRKWRRIPRTVNSEDWVEAIPFTETRRYVTRVLAYQIIYAARLGETPLRLRDLMPPIKPGRS